MNKLRFLSFLFATLAVVTFSSCGDDDEDATPSEVRMLTADTWYGNAVFMNGMDVTDFYEDEFGSISDTDITFNEDGTYEEYYLGDRIDGEWEFSADKRKIIFDKGTSDEYSLNVNKLTSTDLYLAESFVEDGQTYNLEIRYKH